MPGVSAILTAAGESTRMGRPKPLLEWRGTTLVEYQLRSLQRSGASEVIVVLGHRSREAQPRVLRSGATAVINPDYLQGKTTSVRAGLRNVDPAADSILLLAVDQPRTDAIIRTVIDAHEQADALITSPRYRSRGGHPLIFSASLKGELERISEEREGIREVFRAHRHEVNEVEIDDPMIRLDLNTRAQYEQALERYGA